MDNQLSNPEKYLAAALLIGLTLIAMFFITAFWPAALPTDLNKTQTYKFKLFQVEQLSIAVFIDSADAYLESSSGKLLPDTLIMRDSTGTPADTALLKSRRKTANFIAYSSSQNTVNINALLILLVALAGFLGNMIHISTSFTTFVAVNQFKRSWLLWYFVKPFTASALALALYFVFRGNFLFLNSNPSNINIYGLMTLSVLAGLFTDKATIKLKEIFEVVFRSREERPDKLIPLPKVKNVSPLVLVAGIENIIIITGENLDAEATATINDEVVTLSDITKESATIRYTIPASQTNKKDFILIIKDSKDNTVIFQKLELADNPSPVPALTVSPIIIQTIGENTLIITGKSLSGKQFKATINGEDVTVTNQSDTLSIAYTIPQSQQAATAFTLVITDEVGVTLHSQVLTCQQAPAPTSAPNYAVQPLTANRAIETSFTISASSMNNLVASINNETVTPIVAIGNAYSFKYTPPADAPATMEFTVKHSAGETQFSQTINTTN